MFRFKNLFIISLFFICNTADGQIITTIAGNRTQGFSGDGHPATTAELNSPTAARADNMGNVYIADDENNRIRKVDTNGIITTIAGNGSGTNDGDGGQAIAAGIAYISSVAVDNGGNLYIAENSSPSTGSWIRKVNTAGIISTVAGSNIGSSGYTGDGGQATDASFHNIQDVAVDGSGNIYIVDADNQVIRKVNAAGIVTTIAGNGSGGYSGDGSPATSAMLNQPTGVAIDGAGNVYIADWENNLIRKVDVTGIITTIAGGGSGGDGIPATAASLNQPRRVAADGEGNVYIADYGNSRIRKVNTAGNITTIAGTDAVGYSGDGGPATAAELNAPIGVAVDTAGRIYITDYVNYNVRKVYTPAVSHVAVLQPVTKEADVLRIWPEPNDGTFTISISSVTSGPVQVIITNVVGQKIKEITAATNKETEIRLDVPAGMYFVTTVTGDGMQSAKVIVR